MRILAIETSADETALSLLQTNDDKTFDLLAHDVASQIKLHTEYGGIVPMLAKREHMANLPIMLEKIIDTSPDKPDLIAVTYGPGLEPALWTGINFAQDLAAKWNVPIVATDHMHGHIVSSLLETEDGKHYNIKIPQFPAIALLISGGHTQLVLMRDWETFETLGQTVDDSVGEAFDKVARMLGLPYPGGPQIEKLAAHFEMSKSPNIQKSLPRPMLHSKDLNFSFSGLKTAVLYLVKKLKSENPDGELSEDQKIAIAHEFVESCRDVLVTKTARAIEKSNAKSLLVGGGVIASKPIREALTHLADSQPSAFKIYLPDMKFTGDNATMIGIAACLHSKGGTVNLLSPNSPELLALKASGNLALYK